MTNDDPTQANANAESRGPNAEKSSYAKRHAAGKVIAGARVGDTSPALVQEAIASALRVDVTIDRIALREDLERRGVPRDAAWQIALSAFIVENSVDLMTRDELSSRSV